MSILATAATRNIRDANLSVATAFAAAGSAVTSTAWDTGDNTDGIFPENVALEVVVPATANLVSAATLVFTVYADTANPPTTALSPSLTYTITGTAGNGAAATFRWKIPANAGRYIGVNANSGTSGAGNNTAVSFTARLLF